MKNIFRPIPFVRLIIPLMAGIVLGEFVDLPYLQLAWIPLLLLLVFTFNRERLKGGLGFGVAAFSMLFLLGYTLVELKDERKKPDYFASKLTEGKNEIMGQISSMPVPGDPIKMHFKIEGIKKDSGWVKCSGNLAVQIPLDTLSHQLNYGDRIVFSSWINKAAPSKNPKAFDYSRFLHFQNVHHTSYVRGGAYIVLEKNKGSPFFRWSYSIRKKGIKALKKHLKSANEFAVGSALLLGYKDEITEEVQLAYAGTGAMHVLAVSGLHVGILFLIIQFFFQFIKRKNTRINITKFILSMFMIWGFAFLTGASPSVLRAATMFSFLEFGNLLNRKNL